MGRTKVRQEARNCRQGILPRGGLSSRSGRGRSLARSAEGTAMHHDSRAGDDTGRVRQRDDRTASRCLFRAGAPSTLPVLPALRWCYRLPLDAQRPCVVVKGMIAGPACVTRQEMPGRGEDAGIEEQGTTKGSCHTFRHRGWARGTRHVSTGARASCCTDGSGNSKGTAARATSPPSERAVAGGDQIHQTPEGDRPGGGVACGFAGNVEHLVSVACRGSGKGQGDR